MTNGELQGCDTENLPVSLELTLVEDLASGGARALCAY